MGGCAASPGASSSPDPAAAAHPGIISTDSLAAMQARGPLVLVDIRTDVFSYLRGHLPGAVYLNTETLRATRGGIPTQLLDGSAYAALFSRMGLPFDRPVVVYSAGETHNIDATFLAWLLAGFGHPHVMVLDGGFFKWQLEQRPVVQEYPRLAGTGFPASPFQPEQASLNDVQAAVRTGDAMLVDARPPDQYAGEAGAQMRRGHIPGAINHYWQDDLTRLYGAGHHARPRHHRLLQQRDRGQPRALHAAVPVGISQGTGVRRIVDRMGGAGGATAGEVRVPYLIAIPDRS
jgi:thiosulfate/3-mercaptopyruvate sulfurtransferase